MRNNDTNRACQDSRATASNSRAPNRAAPAPIPAICVPGSLLRPLTPGRCLCVVACLFALSVTSLAQSITALVDGGGPVMQARTVFLIFWLPPGFHYDSSNTAAADTKYENLMTQFFTDMSGSTYFNILGQYPGTCSPPAIPTTTACFGTLAVGGTTVDTRAYASGAGTVKSPLTDADIRTEVTNFITTNKLTPDLSMAFFVFLGAGAIVCGPATGAPGCTSAPAAFCAYHFSFATSGGTAIYGVMPNLDSIGGCTESISSGPNQLAADRELIALSHEFSEAVTDPVVGSTGWRASVNGREVGDNCNPSGSPDLGSIASNGSNTTINGHLYVLQTEWSNDDDGCILSFVNNFAGATVQNTFTTGSDDLRDNSNVAGALQGQDGSSAGVFIKSPGQPSWDNGSIHVRVSPNALTAPVQQELLTLTSHNGLFQNNDHWNIQTIDLKLRNPNGTLICDETQTGSQLASITDGSPATFPTPNCLPAPPPQEAVTCSVFDDGDTNQVNPPSDAIFISGRSTNNEKGKACVPGGTFGVCRKWFGLCQTVNTHVSITFQVFNDGYADPSVPSGAVYIPQDGNQACIPDGTSKGFCRRWFGRGVTSDGRKVFCEAFDDGYANPTNLSDAIYIPHPIPGPGQACVPDPTPTGVCRRWWGRCVAR
jgi:hypothetical protein